MPVYDFAVYSSDDGSLTLYHRRRTLLPLKGMVFEGKRVSACFRIGREGRDHGWTADSKCKKAVSVLVADAGIKPKKIDYWFVDFKNLRFVDLSKLDTFDVQHAGGLFCGCEHLEEVLIRLKANIKRFPIASVNSVSSVTRWHVRRLSMRTGSPSCSATFCMVRMGVHGLFSDRVANVGYLSAG